MSLRLRVNLAVSGLLLVFCSLLGGLMVDILRASVQEETEASSKVAAHLIGRMIRAPASRMAPAELVAYLEGLGRVRSQEITIEQSGELIYRSPPPTYKHNREAPAWFGRLMAPKLAPQTFTTGELRISLIADPSRSILDAWDDGGRLAGVLLVLVAALGGVIHWLVGRALSPVDRIVGALKEIEQGDLKTRLPAFAPTEFDRIGRGFNTMAENLGSSLLANLRLEENQRVARLVQDRLEEERKAIARELHDELGQGLTAIRAIAASIAHRCRDTAPELHGSAQSVVSVAGQMYDGVHTLVARLRPAALVGLSLADSLRGAIGQWQARHPDVSMHTSFDGDLDSLGDASQIAVLRVLQESLTNVARHAAATRVDVEVRRAGAAVSINVSDNGRGCETDGNGEGAAERFGLLGMRERVQGLGGRLELSSAAGAGFRVFALIPEAGRMNNEEAGCPDR